MTFALRVCAERTTNARLGKPLDTPLRENPALKPWPKCSIGHCNKTADSKLDGSVCSVHRARFHRTGSYLRSGKRIEQGSLPVCTITGCNKPYRASGLCNAHWVKSRTYNLTSMQLNQLYGDGTCDICGETPQKSLNIDHDHSCCPDSKSCGRCIRGALCGSCNLGLGAFSDSTMKLQKASSYIANYKTA